MDKGIKRQIFIAGIIYLGQMLVGYGMGWTAPVIPQLQDADLTPLPDVISDGQASWLGSLLYVGTIIGPHVTGYLSKTLGRKPCLLLGGALTLLSHVLVVVTRNLAMLLTARIVSGLGIGIIAVCNLVYLGEIASTHIRGILLTCTGIFATMGTLVIYSVGPYVSFSGTGYIGGAMTVFYMVCLYFVPETPAYEAMKGKEDEARVILESLGRHKEAVNATINTKPEEEDPKSTLSTWSEIFTEKSNRKALLITSTLSILQQMSGVVVVTFFATTIFEMAGSSIQPNIATIIIGVTQMVASIVTPFFVERSGRKMLLLVSTAGCCLSLTVLGIYFYLDDIGNSVVGSIGWMPLVTLILFFLSYDFGFGIIPNTLTSELFSDRARSSGSALTITSAWLVGFGVASAFGYAVSGLGPHVTFGLFAAACAGACLFTAFCVPETKGRTLSEIQEILSR